MKNDITKVLNDFIDSPENEDEVVVKKTNNNKKIVLDERDGLIIERIDRQYITSDGRMLLREQY